MQYESDRTTYGYHRAMVLEAAQKLWNVKSSAEKESILFYSSMWYEKRNHSFSINFISLVQEDGREETVCSDRGPVSKLDIKKSDLSEEEKSKAIYWMHQFYSAGEEFAKCLDSALRDFHIFHIKFDEDSGPSILDEHSYVEFS